MNPFMKTLKKIAAAYNGISLILRIAIGLVVGVILALVCPGATWLARHKILAQANGFY